MARASTKSSLSLKSLLSLRAASNDTACSKRTAALVARAHLSFRRCKVAHRVPRVVHSTAATCDQEPLCAIEEDSTQTSLCRRV